ncbi:MAG: hypothetical protein ACRC20_14475 [Segniliparus sp.]|uniref:hypothetical protein n=1 Tax=Segniliparus sp. TaxID=2804064 RepID=UPI003F31EC6F
MPLNKGGADALMNKQAAHRDCNRVESGHGRPAYGADTRPRGHRHSRPDKRSTNPRPRDRPREGAPRGPARRSSA